MEDGDDVDSIRLDAIDQTIGARDQLAQILVIELWHDAPGTRVINQLVNAPRELIDRLAA